MNANKKLKLETEQKWIEIPKICKWRARCARLMKTNLFSKRITTAHAYPKVVDFSTLYHNAAFIIRKFLYIILLNLLKCVLIFYLVYYIVLCFCFTAFRIQMLDGFAPFDFKTKPSWFNPYYLVLIISMEIAYVISGLLFALLVEEWVWDYAITITIIHITVTSAVMAEFPLMLHWWAALGSGLILMICSGQCLAFYLFKDNFIYPVLDDF